MFFLPRPIHFVNIQFILLKWSMAQSEHVKQWLLNETTILAIINYFYFIFFKTLQIHPFFFYVGLCQKKKKRTCNIWHQGLIHKPVAPALCWCNPPGSTPSPSGSRTGLPVREAGALTGTPKATASSVRRVRFTHRLYWHTHLLHWPTVGINAHPEWRTTWVSAYRI